ncbi:acylphosphatase [Mycetocola zhadangensis]|uniref:Acylphosphatase n=1 Tax=Mycetocola zhadangensis TaxID=1164595 RepID=A0A3L7J4C8_9MICO|nr:acylphosphatase [Mycetocola zhadangensis]RLQ84301.1 acylphosphatase [Mycetocola zhadangensis]GGE94273.1 acylphosphatase [Mycetocola zhadangensis]
MIRKHVIVHGTVQGVGFRYWTRAEAQRLGVTGWVRNRLDGTVEAEVEGTEADVSALIEWLRRGPSYATVTGLNAADIEYRGDADFVVL